MRHVSAQIGRPAALHAVLLALLLVSVATGAGCGSKDSDQQADVRAALSAASAALVAKDPVAWFLALPCEGKAAEHAAWLTYSGLSHFPWAEVSARAVPVGGVQGRYRVRFYGRLRGSDTSPLVCERTLDFAWRQGRLKLVADRTEEGLREAYYLAFSDPIVMVRPHLVVVGERWKKHLMSGIAACDGQARRVAMRLRLDAKAALVERQTLVYVCASREQAWDASCSRPHKGMSAGVVSQQIYFVGARGSAYWDRYTRQTVRHELAHLYAAKFGEGKHSVGLLSEGLAVAVEGRRDFTLLRAEVLLGNHVLPLKKALMHGDLWHGLSGLQVELAYLEGGALVLYLEKRWGMKGAWAFADAVAASDMTPVGIAYATQMSLGVSWGELYRGWKRYTLTLR